jgi:hypothetical protein
MPEFLRYIWPAALLALGALEMQGVQAQQPACRPADQKSELLLRDMISFATSTDPQITAVRDSLRILPVPASQVGLITDQTVCTRASAGYQQYYEGVGSGFSGRVYVVRIGTRYAALDPDYPTTIHDPPWHVVIMDSDFRPLGGLSSI